MCSSFLSPLTTTFRSAPHASAWLHPVALAPLAPGTGKEVMKVSKNVGVSEALHNRALQLIQKWSSAR